MSHSVVCISREEGAGGEHVAARVADQLGFRLIDEDIVTRAALEAEVDEGVIADLEERRSLLMRLIDGLGSVGMASGYGLAPVGIQSFGQPASDDLRALIQSVIEQTAMAGEVVIVAHAASLALAQRDDVVRVFLTASPSTRQRRIATERGLGEADASRAVKQSDAGRADYIRRFYRIGEERPTHYDIVINTDKLGPDRAADLIAYAVLGSSEASA